MGDSPSTVGTIDEEKLDIKLNDNLYPMETSFMSLPPPPPVFNNRQNSIQSNNSKDNEMYSIFSNPNTSYNSINESVDSFDQFYTSEYDLNQSLDSIPDSLIDNSTIHNNPSNTTQSTHPLSSSYSFYQVNQNFDGHNQNHQHHMGQVQGQGQGQLPGQSQSQGHQVGPVGPVYDPNQVQPFSSYDNLYDFDFYPPTTGESISPSQGSPSFTPSNFNLNLNLNHNPQSLRSANKIGMHKYNSDLSVNTSVYSGRYGSLSSSNPNSAAPNSAIPPTSATSSIATSTTTSTPVKLENGSFLQLATFRHNSQTYPFQQPQVQVQPPHSQPGSQIHTPHSNGHPAVFSHPSSNSNTPHTHTSVSHPPHSYLNSPRRRTYTDYDDPNTPTTTSTNSMSNQSSRVNSRANSTSNSPLNSSTPSLHTSISTASMSALHHLPNPHLQLSSSDKNKKHTRRRLLPRSKNGCWICRIKHLKCDEMRPHCTSCSKFGIDCDYSPEKPLYVSDKSLRNQKLIEITHIRKNNQKLKSKVSKKRLKEII